MFGFPTYIKEEDMLLSLSRGHSLFGWCRHAQVDKNERAEDTIVSLRLFMDVDRAEADDQGSSIDSLALLRAHYWQKDQKPEDVTGDIPPTKLKGF